MASINLLFNTIFLILFGSSSVFGDDIHMPVWPLPRHYTMGNMSAYLSPNFRIEHETGYNEPSVISNHNLNINGTNRLTRIIARYQSSILVDSFSNIVPLFDLNNLNSNNVYIMDKLLVQINSLNDELGEQTDESYTLTLTPTHNQHIFHGLLKAHTIYGVIYGLETFSQLISKKDSTLKVDFVPLYIADEPLYKHRGLLLDTSRNYYSLDSIRRTIDALSYNKMNVFHWHLIDSHSFPFESLKFPNLTKHGINLPNQIYSQDEIRSLVEYAKDRAVRVIPEIEAPAHAYAIGKVYPEIGVCLNMKDWALYAAEPPSGQLDPTNPLTKHIVFGLIDELSQLFTDEYIHLSGDEINENCWKTSQNIMQFIESNNMSLKQLANNFSLEMQSRASNENHKKFIVWQELLLNNHLNFPIESSHVQVWLGANDVKKVVQLGYTAIASSYEYWYLDCGHGTWLGNQLTNSWCDPYKHWQLMYSYDLTKDLSEEQSKLVVGGEVALWSEQSDEHVVDSYLWPRTCAAAEVLWSGNKLNNSNNLLRPTSQVIDRLNNFRFRLLSRGIKAAPLQPLWCAKNPGSCNLS